MSQQKELMYGTAISITAERALKYYSEMTKEKDDLKFYFALYLTILPDEYRDGMFERDINGTKTTYFVDNVEHNAIISVVGCDKELSDKFLEVIETYMEAIILCHEPEELRNLKMALREAYRRCLANDRKMDQDHLRNQTNIFFNFLDMFKVKSNVDITDRVDEAVKQLQNDWNLPRPKQRSEEE